MGGLKFIAAVLFGDLGLFPQILGVWVNVFGVFLKIHEGEETERFWPWSE